MGAWDDQLFHITFDDGETVQRTCYISPEFINDRPAMFAMVKFTVLSTQRERITKIIMERDSGHFVEIYSREPDPIDYFVDV